MNEVERRPIFDNTIIRLLYPVSYQSKSRTKVIVTEETLEIDNYLVTNIITNNHIIKENYDIIVIDNNHIKLYRKIMKIRNPVQNLIKNAKSMGYDTNINDWEVKICECIVSGEKTIYNDRVTIKYLNRMKEYEEKILNVEIEIKIIDKGYKFVFKTNVKD